MSAEINFFKHMFQYENSDYCTSNETWARWDSDWGLLAFSQIGEGCGFQDTCRLLHCAFRLFQGVAEAELEQNLSRTFKSFFRTSDEVRGAGVQEGELQRCEGGFLGGAVGCVGVWESATWPSFL